MSDGPHTTEEQAALWADRRRRGPLDAEETRRLGDWLAAAPGRAELLDLHEKILGDPALAAASRMVAAEGVRSPRRVWRPMARPVWAAAGFGAVAAAAVVAVLVWPSRGLVHETLGGTAGQTVQASLDDGSSVRLNGDSHIRTAFGAERRDVYLTGEGFFSVAKDARRPFSVFTATHRITAIGTRFNVDERSGGAVEVSVLEGRVEVVALKHPDQRLVLDAGGRLLAQQDGLRSAALARLDPATKTPDWTQGWIDADDMTLSDLVVELKRQSPGFRADFVDPDLSKRRISGRFGTAQPEKVLTAVADMQGLSLRKDASGRLLIDR